MSIISIRFIHQEDIDRWQKLEAKGKIGPRQKAMLEEWRQTHGKPVQNMIGNAMIESARRQLSERSDETT